jgi:hypothetical protein
MHEPHASNQRKTDPRADRENDQQHHRVVMTEIGGVDHVVVRGDYI